MIKLFSWNDVLVASKDKNHLLSQFTKKGSALSVGGFDGPHLGHRELFQQVIDYKTKKFNEMKREIINYYLKLKNT